MRLYTFERLRHPRPAGAWVTLRFPRPVGISYYADGEWRTLPVGAK